jgi:hypothetical protein
MAHPPKTPEAMLARFMRSIEAPESSPTAYLASVLAAGFAVTTDLAEEVGLTRGSVHMVITDMTIAGWVVESNAVDGTEATRGKPKRYQVTHGPGGEPVKPKRGAPPRSVHHERHEERAQARAKQARKRAREAPRSSGEAHERGGALVLHPGFSNGSSGPSEARMALVAMPVVPAPPVGTVFRSVMVAESEEGAPVMALRDEFGAMHFVQAVAAPAGVETP